MTHPALLVLEDGTTLRGTAFGADGETFGEMVFNTAMTGYQETLTDPSYCRQIVAMTAPHIGNTGVNEEAPDSRQAWVSGYVVREPARLASSWRATRDLDAYLRAEGVTGVAVRGTRLLTRRGARRGGAGGGARAAHQGPGCLPARRGSDRDRRPRHQAADPAGARAGGHARGDQHGGDQPGQAARPGPGQPGDDGGRPGPGGEYARAVHRPLAGARQVPRGSGRPGHQGVHAAQPRGPGLRGPGAARDQQHHRYPGRLAGRGVL